METWEPVAQTLTQHISHNLCFFLAIICNFTCIRMSLEQYETNAILRHRSVHIRTV